MNTSKTAVSAMPHRSRWDRRRTTSDRAQPVPMLGHVTSWCASPHVGASIALALVAGGRSRHGERLWAVSPLADARVRVDVGPSCFVDPEGGRLRV
jgi:sarcosine oxidase subunit alpha